ncbi:MAG TPA: cation-transporting P-type ATPase, partial [Actinotalea sp.]|nr:cation-transporting P-type ATPase [Actinotalea sp.]
MPSLRTGSPASPLEDPSGLDGTEVSTLLGVDPWSGLSAAEARRRLAADGPNVLRATPPVPWWRQLLAQFREPLVVLLLV